MAVFMIILFIGIVFAGFSIGELNYNLNSVYGSNENISGWINISFNQELTSSEFKDLNGNSISLLDLLEENPNYNYGCSPSDCLSDYSAVNPETSKTFNLTFKSAFSISS